ncbi:bh protein [Halanaerobium congolense]|jgi:transcription elongation factor Elf1|nr:bh protein [Halanaerobium congolense]
MEKVETYLHCVQCDEETEHVVIYLDDEIKSIKCKKCDRVSGIDKKELFELYTVETVEHILKEPLKLNEGIKEDGSKFLFSFSKRLLTKPYRVIKEVFELLED